MVVLSNTLFAETWKGLEVREEFDDDDCPTYRSVSSDYAYSSNTDLVIEKSLGGFYSPYDDVWYDEATDVDIDHIVARKEAHESGMCKATPEVRYKFANDLLNLTLSTPSLNRNEKSDKDAGEWLPQYNKCWYVFTVIQVKKKYGMSVDSTERDAMQEVLESCTGDEIFLEPEKPDEDEAQTD
ncbi:MAG: HNH endonuclease family protein [Gammaproteobacteria bacterium]|nr:HNH endonuclease family protein [Gammaproteobacteria bacterium]